jgi:hypothetical protein
VEGSQGEDEHHFAAQRLWQPGILFSIRRRKRHRPKLVPEQLDTVQ